MRALFCKPRSGQLLPAQQAANYPAFRFAAGAALLSCGLAMLVTGGISDTGVTGLRQGWCPAPRTVPISACDLLLFWVCHF